MPSILVISREPRTRTAIVDYVRDRGYDAATAESYDHAMHALERRAFGALIVDIQGLPRGEDGSTFALFNQWLGHQFATRAPAVIYLLHKGARRPHLRVEGPVIRKPFPLEAIGEALRECVGLPGRGRNERGLDLDMASNTLRCGERQAHLTNIEATLLAYLMEHEGETLHPRDLLVDVWQYHDAAGASTLVRAHISNLRKKLRQVLGSDDAIQTVRGKGYRFVA